MNRLVFAFITLLLAGCSRNPAPDYLSVYEEIKYSDKMVFASMAVTKTVKTDRTDWYKMGKRIAVYSYDTYLEAYVDLSRLEMEDLEFDEKNKSVTVILPPVEVAVAGRDMELRKEYENIGMFRSSVGAEERARMKEKANTSLKKELESNPEYKQRLIETARRKARMYFQTLLENAGYAADIRFSDQIQTTGDFNLKNYE